MTTSLNDHKLSILALKFELKTLARLGVPVVLGQLGMMSLHVMDTLMLGRFGVSELAAASLGTQWIFMTLTMGMGLTMGIDPIVAQRHGARDGVGCAHSLHHGLIIAFIASVPVTFAWLFTYDMLIAAGQDERLSAAAHRYVTIQIPSIFPFLGWSALRSYLQGRGIVKPAMWVMVPVNLLNVFLNWLLIFGPGELPALGLDGAAWATTTSRALTGVLLGIWVYSRKLHVGAWAPFEPLRRTRWSELKSPLALGFPIAIQFGLEVTAFGLTALIAGQLGEKSLAAHSIVLSVATLLFMTPLGIAIGTTTRVGNLIGQNRGNQLNVTLRAALSLGGLAMLLNVSILSLGRSHIASAYSLDSEVQMICSGAFLVAAVFQVSDCTQVIASGALRGMGRARAPAVATFLGYYVFGIPCGYYLGVVRGLGLTGLWWGLALGLTIVAVVLVAWLGKQARVAEPLAPI